MQKDAHYPDKFLFIIIAAQNNYITLRQSEILYEKLNENPYLDIYAEIHDFMNPKDIAVVESLMYEISSDKQVAKSKRLYSLSAHNKIFLDDDTSVSVPIGKEQSEHYEVLGQRGRGGMGRVLVAFDRFIGRKVAIKELFEPVLEHGVSLDLVAERFLREARITGQLEHPSIVPVHEIAQRADGTLYYSMKLVKGKTLTRAIEACDSLEEALLLIPHFRDLCHAISYAHSKGIVHRDIKPDNVMIGEFGETVVLDWGLSKSIRMKEERIETDGKELCDIKSGETVQGRALGTPPYMSPEQARGDVDEMDEQSDIYALGAVFYQIITGHPPFMGDFAQEVIAKVLHEEFLPFNAEENPPPPELQTIAAKALHKEKENRYQRVKEFVHDVESYMSGERVESHNYSIGELLNLFIRQHKPLMGMFLTLFVGLFLMIAAVYYQYLKTEQQKVIAEQSLHREQKARENEKQAARESKFHYAQALSEMAGTLLEEKAYDQSAIYAMASLVNNPAHPDSKWYHPSFSVLFPESVHYRAKAASYIYLLQLKQQVNLLKIVKHPDSIFRLDIASDRSRAATACRDGKVRLFSISDWKIERTIDAHSEAVNAISFSPDGKKIVTGGREKKIRIWDVETGKKLKEIEMVGGNAIYSIAWSPSGKKIVYGTFQGRIIVLNSDSGKVLKNYKAHQWYVRKVIFVGDDEYLVTTSSDSTVKVWKGTTGKLIRSFAGHTERVWNATLLSDNRTLASTGSDLKVRLWDLKTGKILKTFSELEGPGYGIIHSPSDKYIVVAGWDQKIRFLNIDTVQQEFFITAHTSGIWDIEWSIPGKELVSVASDGAMKVWSISLENQTKYLHQKGKRIWRVQYAPNGKYFASSDDIGDIVIRKSDTGKIIRVLNYDKTPVYGFSFSPDSSQIVSGTENGDVILWDVESGKILHKYSGHSERLWTTRFSTDGSKIISSSSSGKVIIWKKDNSEPHNIFQKDTDRIWNVKYSPDDKYIALTSSNNTAMIVDSKTLKIIKTYYHDNRVTGVDWSPDGRYIYTSGKDKIARKWNVEKGTVETKYIGHRAWVNYIHLSPDGNYLLTSSDDMSIRVWDEKTGAPVLVIKSMEAVAINWSPDGKSILFNNVSDLRKIPFIASQLTYNPARELKRAEHKAGLYLDGFQLKVMTEKQFKQRGVSL